jgi:zinc protease
MHHVTIRSGNGARPVGGALAVALTLIAASAAAQTAPASAVPPSPVPTLNLQQPVPFDARVRTGTLPNGLTYFIRANAQPAKRVSMRLAVKAGSLFEADDQQGLAHFLEHMAFNGSDHFKPGELVSFFESTGARLGPHVNAYTSFDETVYMLDLPTDSATVVSRGLTALADFAGGLTLDPEQVDRERGVVVEEWRGRLGAGSRVRDQQFPVMFHNSRYANRLPIGKPEILRSAPPQRLRDFYDAWYRPERMAMIIVGDIDTNTMEAGIREVFGPLKARAAAIAPPDATVPLHRESLVNITSDSEVTSSTVQFLRKRAREGSRLVGDYRRSLVETMFTRMLNDRFGELARKPDAAFLAAGGGSDGLSPTVTTFGFSARVKDGGIPAGLTALQIEARRVQQHGFAASELDRTKRWLAAFYERAYNERDKNESASFAQEYLNFFLSGEPSPGIEYERGLVQQVLPTVTVDDINTLARERLSGEGMIVLAVSPRKDGLAIPSEADLRNALSEGDKVAVTPWSDATTTRALVERVPAPAAVTARREIPAIGVTVLTFANGVEAWLKPTDFKNDQVLFTMYANGGLSIGGEPTYLQASFATRYVGLSGLGGIKALDLDKLLAGKIASASPFIGGSTHGINGSAAPGDLETALQLLYQSFVAPGDDPESLALMKRQLEAALANRGRSPGQVFGERVAAINSSNHYTAKPLLPEDVAKLDRTAMLDFYRARFANAADFTFFMVGAFKIDEVTPLLGRYVGSLPSTGRRTSASSDIGVRFPTGVQREKVAKGREPRSQTIISFFADPSFEPIEQERALATTSVLQTILRDALREELGQTYTVSVGLQQSAPQRGDGSIAVVFGAAPENIDTMTERVLQEIRKIQTGTLSADAVANAKEGAKRDYETALRQNNYWLRRLQTVHLLGGNPEDIATRIARIDSLTPAIVQEAFRKYYPMDRHTVVTLVPE